MGTSAAAVSFLERSDEALSHSLPHSRSFSKTAKRPFITDFMEDSILLAFFDSVSSFLPLPSSKRIFELHKVSKTTNKRMCVCVCESANLRVCEFANLRVYEFANLRICEYADLRICEFESLRVCEYASLRICGSLNVRICKLAILRICESVSLRFCVFANFQICDL